MSFMDGPSSHCPTLLGSTPTNSVVAGKAGFAAKNTRQTILSAKLFSFITKIFLFCQQNKFVLLTDEGP